MKTAFTAIALTIIALLICCRGGAGEGSNGAAAELRAASFEYLKERLAKSPLKEVPWPMGSVTEKAAFDKIDMPGQSIHANIGGLTLDLKWKNIDNRQLSNLLRAAGGPEAEAEPRAYALCAALLAADGMTDLAQVVVEKASLKDPAAQTHYDEWAKRLGVNAPAAARPVVMAGPGAGAAGPALVTASAPPTPISPTAKHAVPKEHPRILGSRAYLQGLRAARASAWADTVKNARDPSVGEGTRIPALALVCALDGDAGVGKEAVRMALKHVNGPIKTGHVTFGHDLALCAMAYDLCHEHWTDAERQAFHAYFNKTWDANTGSETHCFHNGYYGYKNWGLGLAAYATMHENPRAPEILQKVLDDYRTRAAPALDMAGEGGGWAEGHYIHYWIYEWLVFCEAARHCEGVDLYEAAPRFFRSRAVASLFEMWPGTQPHELNRPVPMGDGGYGIYGGYSEKILAARRMLVSRYRDDPAHAFAGAYNRRIPGCCIPEKYSYMNFLWNDPASPAGDLKGFKLSHYSAGPGWAAARSSWEGDATYFLFHCGDRYTAHQHLDVGHFLIFKHAPLAGDGGVYDRFDSNHAANYYLRSIAHNTILVHDPAEKFPDGIRAGPKSANDGGQSYAWMGAGVGHNGGVDDVETWKKHERVMDLADFLAFEDHGSCAYVAGDCSRAYSPQKLEFFTRQIVYLRPDTFVIFDRVRAKNAGFRKTWLLQAMNTPTGSAPNLIVTNGKGRLFVQTVLPASPQVKLCSGKGLYTYNGQSFPPGDDPTGPVPECRVEISPSSAAETDYFLHVLTAAEASTDSVPQGSAKVNGSEVVLTLGTTTLRFQTGGVGGKVEGPAGNFTLSSRIVAK